MYRFHISVFNCVEDGDAIVYTHTSIFDMEVLPKTMDVKAYLSAPIFNFRKYTVDDLLEDRVF